MNFKRWKLGLVIAIICALLNAGAGLVGDMGWKSFIAVLCTALLTNLGNFLKQHPVEDISFDTTSYRPTTTTKPAEQNQNEK